jgi:hypothetical protein
MNHYEEQINKIENALIQAYNADSELLVNNLWQTKTMLEINFITGQNASQVLFLDRFLWLTATLLIVAVLVSFIGGGFNADYEVLLALLNEPLSSLSTNFLV